MVGLSRARNQYTGPAAAPPGSIDGPDRRDAVRRAVENPDQTWVAAVGFMDNPQLRHTAGTETDPDRLTVVTAAALHRLDIPTVSALLDNPALSARSLEQIAATIPNVVTAEDQWHIWAAHPNAADVDMSALTETVTEASLSDTNPKMRHAVAGHPSLTADLAEFLADDPDENTRKTVAGNPNTPAEVLTVLAGDISTGVRSRVAANPTCPPEALRVLHRNITRSHDNTDTMIAEHRNCPADLLTELAGSDVHVVRDAVAANPNTPSEVLAVLRRDPQPAVRRSAWRTSVSRTPPTG